MKIIFLILLSLYFIPNKVFGNMYDLNSDKQINKTMKWNCPGGDFSWQYFDQNLKMVFCKEPIPEFTLNYNSNKDFLNEYTFVLASLPLRLISPLSTA